MCGTCGYTVDLDDLTGSSIGNVNFAGNQLTGTVPSRIATLLPPSSTVWSNNCIINATTILDGCTSITDSERSALLDFYFSTGGGSGGSWVQTSGWVTRAHPCTWFGVTCLGGSVSSGPVVYVVVHIAY